MQSNCSFWTGHYDIKAKYKYQKEVEAFITFDIIQKNRELTGQCLLKKQAIWKEDMKGVLEGILDDNTSKKVKLNIKWYNSAGNFQNQSDLMVTMSEDYQTFEGIIKNMMYTGLYYGTKIIEQQTVVSPQMNNNVRKPGLARRRSEAYEAPIVLPDNNNNINRQRNKSVNVEEAKTNTQNTTKVIAKDDKKVTGLTSEDLKVCIICCEKPKQSVFVPCGHKCCCEECAEKFINKHKCPFCKKSVESIIKKVFE
jgi:hypothetical protein